MAQCSHQAWAAVSAKALVKGALKCLGQDAILAAAHTPCFVAVGIKATARNAQGRAGFAHFKYRS